MHRKVNLLGFLVIIAAVSVSAQMNATPGPEVKKLDYFAGTWTTEGTVAQGPWGAGGKFASTETSQWMPGNFFLESHADFKMPSEVGGDGKGVSYMGYDTDQSRYTFDAFNSQGRRETSKGTLSGDTWTWTSTANYGGMEIQQKMTMKVLSATSYNMKFEISIDGKTWTTFMEGKATKK